ncbi:hypothetical protein D3C75_842280 [compost metagenome]
MRKGIGSNNSLVARNSHPGQLADQTAGTGDFRQDKRSLGTKKFAACLQCQSHFFNRRIAGPFPNAVDRTLNLIRTVLDRGQCIGSGHAQVIMTVGTKLNLLNIRHCVLQEFENSPIFRRVQVTDRIGNIHHICSFTNSHGHHFSHEITLGTSCILQRKFQLGEIFLRIADCRLRSFEHLGFIHPKLMLPVNRRGSQENMNTRVLCSLQRFSYRVNIGLSRA